MTKGQSKQPESGSRALGDIARSVHRADFLRGNGLVWERHGRVSQPLLVEAAGPPGVLRTVQFARGKPEEGLAVVAPIVVEGVLRVIRHPARGQFPAVVELQVREARRVE